MSAGIANDALAAASFARNAETQGRFHALDAMRGVAAFGVVLTHCLQRALPEGTLNHTPFRIFTNGRSFVIFFFVLSGFVLTNSVWASSREHRGYIGYVKRRLLRLFPPYAVAGILGAIVLFAIQGPDWQAIVDYFAVDGTTRGIEIDPPSWSMVYELRLSLIIPLIAYLVPRHPVKGAILTMALFATVEVLIIALHIGQFPYGVDNAVAGMVVTLRYAVAFTVGAFVAYDYSHQRRLIGVVNSRPVLWFGLAVVLMSVLLDQFSLVGATILLALVLGWQPLGTALSHPILSWLGRISFSLYLTHFLVLEALIAALGHKAAGWEIAAMTIPLALLVAQAFYEWVEKPSIRWSRSVGAPKLSQYKAAG